MVKMKIKILFCVMLVSHINIVDSQRISEIKCHEYSRIPINKLKPFSHMAIWESVGSAFDETEWEYVILISDKFLIGNDIRNWGIPRKTYNNTIYFNVDDVHNVTKIVRRPGFSADTNLDYYSNILLLQINRITLDSHHRAACLWSRNDFMPSTVEVMLQRRVGNFNATDFEMNLITRRVFSDIGSGIIINKTKHILYFEYDNRFPNVTTSLLQIPKPIYYLPTNYYVYGFGLSVSRQRRYNIVSLTDIFDWIESVVWGTGETSCGTATTNINPVILHSEPTSREEFPWHVAIFYIISAGRREYKCGGTLVNENTVVTAAHCVSTPNGVISHVVPLVILGKHDLNINSLDSRETLITKILVHKSYNRHNYESDIALLKLQTMMQYTKYIQPICVTSNRQLFENPIGVLPGWGMNELNQTQSILAKASFPIRPHSECRGHGDIISAVASFVNENNFCAGYQNGTSLCNGDSGGGLVFKVNNQWFLRGIASIGAALGEARQCDPVGLNLFTDVIQFYEWILDGMN